MPSAVTLSSQIYRALNHADPLLVASIGVSSVVTTELVSIAIQAVLGCVLLYAGLQKILQLASFVDGAVAYNVLPVGAARRLFTMLPFVEVGLGVALLAGFIPPWPAVAAMALSVIFAAAAMINIHRGRAIPCHCFSESERDLIGPATVARQVGLIGIASMILVLPQPVGFASFITAASGEQFVAVVSIVAFAVLLLMLIAPMEVLVREIRNIRQLKRSVQERRFEDTSSASVGLSIGESRDMVI